MYTSVCVSSSLPALSLFLCLRSKRMEWKMSKGAHLSYQQYNFIIVNNAIITKGFHSICHNGGQQGANENQMVRKKQRPDLLLLKQKSELHFCVGGECNTNTSISTNDMATGIFMYSFRIVFCLGRL